MMDIGLLVSIVAMIAVPVLFLPAWPSTVLGSGLFDVGVVPLLVGVGVGRVAAMVLDGAGSVTRLSDVLIIRSGVEFWPGVVAGGLWLAVSARRDGVAAIDRLAAVAPAAVLCWAVFEATCPARDGCPGPVSSVGLRPDGLTHRVFPIGLAVAAAGAAASLMLELARRQRRPSAEIVAGAISIVALIRSIASVWLPRIGGALTRQHRASLIVLAAGTCGWLWLRMRRRIAP
jgi:4-amino-4-deoxy-L-arabinose transferase-like glycosyltransferase